MMINSDGSGQAFKQYRLVAIGEVLTDAVTVGIEPGDYGKLKAAIWWEAKGDVDADEAEFDDVEAALSAAEASRALHGFAEVVVVLAKPSLWRQEWGALLAPTASIEPIGNITHTDLNSSEAYALAAQIEAEQDA